MIALHLRHLLSNRSDARFGPERLLNELWSTNVKVVSLTDHQVFRGLLCPVTLVNSWGKDIHMKYFRVQGIWLLGFVELQKTASNCCLTRVQNSGFLTFISTFLLFKVSNKILLTRKENEVEELKCRVEETKIKLGSEMKV